MVDRIRTQKWKWFSAGLLMLVLGVFLNASQVFADTATLKFNNLTGIAGENGSKNQVTVGGYIQCEGEKQQKLNVLGTVRNLKATYDDIWRITGCKTSSNGLKLSRNGQELLDIKIVDNVASVSTVTGDIGNARLYLETALNGILSGGNGYSDEAGKVSDNPNFADALNKSDMAEEIRRAVEDALTAAGDLSFEEMNVDVTVREGEGRPEDEEVIVATIQPNENEIAAQNGGGGNSATTCGTGAAGSLGWIICPVLNFMQWATNTMYDDFVAKALTVPPRLFQVMDNNGNTSMTNSETYKVWQTFQQIANVVFIILLLVVIFSQLTGVGIDNYGIKRILPKLIIAAVLVNVSYYICVLAVDLSNIFGVGAQDLFDSIGGGIAIPNIEGKAVASTAMTGVGILAIIAGAATIWANPAIVLSLLVSAIGAAISVLFMFLILSVRQAAIVVLTVVAPVAIACYTLPNTKKIFDKWLQAGWALLLIFPICGILVGGGNFVSKLLLSAMGGDIYSAFIAMVAGIAPIFFIPSLLRSSMKGLGDLGGRIAGFGQNIRGRVDRGIRSSDGYKAAQMAGQNNALRIRAGYNRKGRPTAIGALKAKVAGSSFGRWTGYQRLQAARVAQANKNRETDIQSGAELRNVGFRYDRGKEGASTQTDEAYFTERLTEARDAGNENEMFAVIEQMRKSNMKTSDMAKLTRNVLGSSNKLNGMNDGQRRNFLEQFSQRYGNDFLKKDYEQLSWAKMGGINKAGTVAAVTGWAVDNVDIDDMKDEDVAALSSSNLEDLIKKGKISQAQAQRVWASNSSMDDTNRLMLGGYGAGGKVLNKEDAQKALREVAEARKQGRAVNIANTGGMTMDQVDAFTRRAAESVVIEDVDIRNRTDGSNRQSNDLYVRRNTGQIVNPAPRQQNPPASGGAGGGGTGGGTGGTT
ncbi:hypothetical protein IKE83_00490 [Candidatus Saccharibacteria bacterium]|nr:hypothetical protein [Candidatus Saccharibacteria bacterium]